MDPARKHCLLRILLLSLPYILDADPPSHLNSTTINTASVIHAVILEIEDLEDPTFDWADHIAIYNTITENERPCRPRSEQGGQRITEWYLRGLKPSACLWAFQFTADQLLELVNAMHIPDPFLTTNPHHFTAIEAISFVCAHYRSSGDIYDLVTKYDRSQAAISELMVEMVMYLDTRWEHLLQFDHDFILSPEMLVKYAQVIRDRGSPLWTLFGFIDCTIRRMAHPTWNQRAAYNGHKKFHALKYQAVILPNGIISHLFGPIEGCHYDTWMLEESGFLRECREHALVLGTNENDPIENHFFQIFGDSAYGVGAHIQSNYHEMGERTEDELAFNAQMGKLRIVVKHGFGMISTKWPWLNAGWKMHLYASLVGLYYRIGVLLFNAHNCLNPNQVAQYFDLLPPDIHDYFHD